MKTKQKTHPISHPKLVHLSPSMYPINCTCALTLLQQYSRKKININNNNEYTNIYIHIQ